MKRLNVRARLGAVALAAVSAVAATAAPASAISVSLTASPTEGVWGTQFLFRGFTSPSTQVRLERRTEGTTKWVGVATKTTSDGGYYFFYDEPSQNAAYRTIVPSDGSLSNGVYVRVRVGVHISVDSSGDRALFTGKVLPAQPGTRVILQMYDGINKVWNNVLSSRLNSRSAYAMRYKATNNGRRLFRVVWPTQGTKNLWNVSSWVSVSWVS